MKIQWLGQAGIRLENDGQVVLIDPWIDENPVSNLNWKDVNADVIILTHGHFDHIMGLDALLEEYPVPVYVHEAEKGLIADPKTNLSLTYTLG